MTSQRHWRPHGRIAVGMVFTAVAGFTLAGPAPSAVADPTPDEVSIGRHDEKLLSEAIQRGQRTVTLLVMTKRGAAAQGVEQLTRAGARVVYRADEVGYVRVEAPVDQAKKLAALPAVQAVDVDKIIPLEDVRPAGQVNPTPQPPPDANTPRVNAYMPTGDTGAAQFAEAHPTWDGRGATIAIVDSGIDLDHPALNVTSTGERKIVDWTSTTDSRFVNGSNGDPTWLHMTRALPSEYQPPTGAGAVRFGVFDERHEDLTGGRIENDVNRDGNPPGSIGTFGVAWDQATDTVWVDVNQNKTFADDKAMTNYKVRYDVNRFGTDNPATPIKEAMPFVVQTSPDDDSVNIGITSDPHGSHVAGIAAGNRLFGGAMSGAAPGAKLVAVRACLFDGGCPEHGLREGMIYAASKANADVINLSTGGLIALNDGNEPMALLFNRLIDTYDVQMFLSGGNSGPGENTTGTRSAATKVIASGFYISRASWQRNYGSDAAAEDNLHPMSGRGPREDGGLKPNIVAPGSAISTIQTWLPGQPIAGTYPLPPGYAMFNGTSMASPQTAGAAALLVSAARANGVPVSAVKLRHAITSSARFIPGYQAYEQGNGLVRVDRAWEVLRTTNQVTDIQSSVPVRTALSGLLPTPNVGVGIHDREGVRVGDTYSREYTFVRNSGPDGSVTYQVSWVGNDGTFSSPGTITLRKGAAVKFRVDINPRSVGAHSALLTLDSPLAAGFEHRTMNTVVAAEDFNAGNGFVVRRGGSLNRNQTVSHFVRVAPGTSHLKVDMQGGGTAPGAGQLRFQRYTPGGTPTSDTISSTSCFNPPVPGGSCGTAELPLSPTSRTVAAPSPGVWEIVVEARRTSDTTSAPYTVTASVFGGTITPNPDIIPSAQVGQPINRQYTLKNDLAAFTGRATGTALGSASRVTPTIADGAQQEYQVMVTPGTTQLRARIGGTSDPGADLDLFVFDCTSGTCVRRDASADGDSEEEVTIKDGLTPGRWMVQVDGFKVPAGTTTYKYLDVFTNPSFGSLTVTDANTLRRPGAEWTVPAVLTPKAAPASGRVLYGNVELRTNTDPVLGSAEVIVQSVS